MALISLQLAPKQDGDFLHHLQDWHPCLPLHQSHTGPPAFWVVSWLLKESGKEESGKDIGWYRMSMWLVNLKQRKVMSYHSNCSKLESLNWKPMFSLIRSFCLKAPAGNSESRKNEWPMVLGICAFDRTQWFASACSCWRQPIATATIHDANDGEDAADSCGHWTRTIEANTKASTTTCWNKQQLHQGLQAHERVRRWHYFGPRAWNHWGGVWRWSEASSDSTQRAHREEREEEDQRRRRRRTGLVMGPSLQKQDMDLRLQPWRVWLQLGLPWH